MLHGQDKSNGDEANEPHKRNRRTRRSRDERTHDADDTARRIALNRASKRRRRGKAAAQDSDEDDIWKEEPGIVSRTVDHWMDRLAGAASDGSLGEQEEEYEAHLTTRDYVCNSIGEGMWGFLFPILTIVVTQLVGTEQAGIFSLAFVTGSLLLVVANYGVRTFQISDLSEEHTFLDYQINRILTCAIMIVAGIVYCTIRGYSGEYFTISIGVYVYRMIDGLADVYEGRLQQADKLYLAGISMALRSVLVIVVFSVILFITRNLSVACVAMAAAAILSLLVITLPLALMETEHSRFWSFSSVCQLFKCCFPLFVALFLYTLIDNMPKFLMEGTLSYDNQLYFNVLYFPAKAILMVTQLAYRPLLLRLANSWEDPNGRRQFNLIMGAILGANVAVTLVMLFIMGWIGIPINSFLYGVDFEQYRTLVYLMIVAGGVTSAIDFMYQVITIQRRQSSVTKLYVITAVFSVVITLILLNTLALTGAVIAYLATMCFLLVLLLLQFANIDITHRRRSKPSVQEQGVGQIWE